MKKWRFILAIYGPTGDHGNLEAHAKFEIDRLSSHSHVWNRKDIDWESMEITKLLNAFAVCRRFKALYFTKKNWDVVSTKLINGGYSERGGYYEGEVAFVLHVEKIIPGNKKKS